MDYQVYVISANRYDKLPFTAKEKGTFIFLVKEGQKSLYEAHGCKKVVESGNLMDSRNFALEHAFAANKICVQLSDDCKGVKTNGQLMTKKKVPLSTAIHDIVQKFKTVKGVNLLGVPPTDNDFFAGKLIVMNKFCIGDMLFVKPSTPRFDTQLTLKEDYDFTLQHMRLGTVLRYQKYLFSFQHYTNKGGAVDVRTDEEEQKNIRILMNKWPDKIRLNPKRKNEILMR